MNTSYNLRHSMPYVVRLMNVEKPRIVVYGRGYNELARYAAKSRIHRPTHSLVKVSHTGDYIGLRREDGLYSLALYDDGCLPFQSRSDDTDRYVARLAALSLWLQVCEWVPPDSPAMGIDDEAWLLHGMRQVA